MPPSHQATIPNRCTQSFDFVKYNLYEDLRLRGKKILFKVDSNKKDYVVYVVKN